MEREKGGKKRKDKASKRRGHQGNLLQILLRRVSGWVGECIILPKQDTHVEGSKT